MITHRRAWASVQGGHRRHLRVGRDHAHPRLPGGARLRHGLRPEGRGGADLDGPRGGVPQHDPRAECVFALGVLVCLTLTRKFNFCAVKKQVTLAPSALEACKQKEAVVIATEWKEFREISWQTVYDDMTKPAFVFDGRMIVDADKLREIGFKVRHVCLLPVYVEY